MTQHVLQAIAAVAAYPAMQRQVAAALEAQARRISERGSQFLPRPDVLLALDAQLATLAGGLLLLEGPAGAGVTSLLCHLAAQRGCPIWLPDDDANDGLAALCAQLIARYHLPVPLVPPAANRDASTLERLLAEAVASPAHTPPLLVLIDQLPERDATANPLPFPTNIPPGVVVVYGCTSGAGVPWPVAGRVLLPARGAALGRLLTTLTAGLGCEPELASDLIERSAGVPLYIRLAAGLLKSGVLRRKALPFGLDGLYEAWWNGLDSGGQRAGLTLAAAREPLPLALWAAVASISATETTRYLRRWRPLLEHGGGQVALVHRSLRAFLVRKAADKIASTHAAFVALAHERAAGRLDQLRPGDDGYLIRQLARHTALSDEASRPAAAELASRAWALAQQRRSGNLRSAAHDAAWVLRVAADEGLPARLLRAAALAGTLTTLGRSLPAEGLAEAFSATLARGEPRDATLRRARSLLDQLPEGHDKANALRRLGEACHEHKMRVPALRMLSEALDLEVPGVPRAWREEREETLVAFARAAISANAPDIALGITVRINHPERRGLIETEVLRWLLGRGQLTRAEEVAYAIGHESMHEWAMAEVVVAQARAGNAERAEVVLSTLKTETAVAWARAELAADLARTGDRWAIQRVVAIRNPRLRDTALAVVAQALLAGQQFDAALAACQQISDAEGRARALLDLALHLAPQPSAALAGAASAVRALNDDRLPHVVALAAAYATCGELDNALQVANWLPEGEERDRAHSRIAVALARRGDQPAARLVADTIPDNDERDWTYHELSRLAGDWHAALALTELISDAEVQARALADVCIARARAGDAQVAQVRAAQIGLPAEQLRALLALAEPLVRQGGTPAALVVLDQLSEPEAHSRYQAALALALAAHGDPSTAQRLAVAVMRPLDRGRVLLSIARTLSAAAPQQAFATLGLGLRTVAALGRSETLACLAHSADALVALAGPELLLATAVALDEIDGWWW